MNNLGAGVPLWHDRLLTLALAWLEQHPGFTFNLRKTEMPGKTRLRDGYWFTGTEQYLFFAPFRPGDRDNKTKTIGFVIQFDAQQRPRRCYLEVVFGNLEDPSLLSLHQQLRDFFEMQQIGTKQTYRRDYPLDDVEGAFGRIMSEDLPRVRQIIDTKGLGDRFVVSEADFDAMLKRTLAVRESRSLGQPSLILIGTWKGLDDGVVAELQQKIARNGAWSSDWSFSLKQTARDRLRLPFHVYLNVGNNCIRYRLKVADYQLAPDAQGFSSPWPEITDSDRLDAKMELNGKQQPLRTRFKITGVERLDRDLGIKDFVPALDTQENALLNQAAFGYAYLRSEVPVNRTVPSTPTDKGNPVNQIFYGPPGTGKTFNLQGLFSEYTDDEGEVDRTSWTQKLLGEVGWRAVIAAALEALGGMARAPEIRDHALVALKAQLNGRSPKNMLQTIWGFLQEHTPRECEHVQSASRREPFLFNKSEDGRWSLLESWQQLDPESAELVKQLKQGPTADAEPAKRYRVVTFHPSFGYEDFIRGIRPVVDPDSGESRFAMVDGVFKQICDEARANPGKRYALFIDEINRANIAKVFGELITLIEIDKRAHYDASGRLIQGMEVQLPGSVDEADLRGFGVPANLDLYGTMNTADRSIALLDIALRRRFQFIERAPDYTAINETIEGVHLGALLRRINDRLEYLLDRDHRIGHAYFIDLKSLDALRSCFEQKILPLLQEYFFDDTSRVAMVLSTSVGQGFLKAEIQSPDALFPATAELGRLQARTRYTVTPSTGWTSAMFRGIYESGSAVSLDAESDQDEVEPDSLDD